VRLLRSSWCRRWWPWWCPCRLSPSAPSASGLSPQPTDNSQVSLRRCTGPQVAARRVGAREQPSPRNMLGLGSSDARGELAPECAFLASGEWRPAPPESGVCPAMRRLLPRRPGERDWNASRMESRRDTSRGDGCLDQPPPHVSARRWAGRGGAGRGGAGRGGAGRVPWAT
jgi:hypothetical protein